MKRAIIDIGSNSIRLLIEGHVDKKINTTQLAEGLSLTGKLNDNAMDRTVKAICEFYYEAVEAGASKVYAFATEAVRSAANGAEFVNRLQSECDVEIEILTPDKEAQCGYLGAAKGGKCCIIDIGGASTEIIAGNEDDILYSKSVPVGIVRLKDLCGQDIDKLNEYVANKIKEYGIIPEVDYAVAIGGTASTVVSIFLEGYNREEIHNYLLTRVQLHCVLNELTIAKDLTQVKGLPPMRATVIIGGIILLDHIMEMLNLDEIVVSEEDNMEGYLKLLDG